MANSAALIILFLAMFGPTPVHNPTIPSDLIIFVYASITPLYLLTYPSFNLPSAYNLILTTSVGLATIIPMAPVVSPANTL